MEDLLRRIGAAFGREMAYAPIGNGHINDTFLSEDGSVILQRINTYVFRQPADVMENIAAVTAHIRSKLQAEGADVPRGTLTVLPTASGDLLYADESGSWRMYAHISGTHSVEPEERTLAEFGEAARAFGHFQRMLADFPADTLHDTIPRFHDTLWRTEQLRTAIHNCTLPDRREKAAALIADAHALRRLAPIILDEIRAGTVPLAVTHNEINNVLFDDLTGKAVAVIDLDTVMPGSRLYDFGDAIRSGAVTAAEDEPDAQKVHFDPEAYRIFRKEYLREMGGILTDAERKLLLASAWIATYECGIRFLADYLENDIYYKTTYPEHNLIRARNQFLLLHEMMEYPDSCDMEDEDVLRS